MEYFLVYLVTRLDGLHTLFLVLLYTAVAVYVISLFVKDPDEHTGLRKFLSTVALVFGLLAFFVPDTREAAAIIVGGKLLQATNSDLAERSVQVIEDILRHQVPGVQ